MPRRAIGGCRRRLWLPELRIEDRQVCEATTLEAQPSTNSVREACNPIFNPAQNIQSPCTSICGTVFPCHSVGIFLFFSFTGDRVNSSAEYFVRTGGRRCWLTAEQLARWPASRWSAPYFSFLNVVTAPPLLSGAVPRFPIICPEQLPSGSICQRQPQWIEGVRCRSHLELVLPPRGIPLQRIGQAITHIRS